ncbi:GNAT family N-acetyltransferase [Rummeliibacillus pycnus]|uniref:GNAT family N-acetyltransferase n=1 Tax=Rummeliibacillus pycnus TaxID=101070 RepID=UPI0037C8ACE4
MFKATTNSSNRQNLKFLADEKNYFWCTYWIIISKDINEIVGGIMIKGTPNDNGEVVIGYYTLFEHQGNDFMTEAIRYSKNWLLNQVNVIYVIVDKEKDNIASHRILEKIGTDMYKETEELFFWGFSTSKP